METIVRATITFWLLWFLLRAAGKRELAEMTPFELILLMVMGDLIQQAVTQEDMSVTGAAMAVSTMMLWALALSYVSFKSHRAAAVLESVPASLSDDDGSVEQAARKREAAARAPTAILVLVMVFIRAFTANHFQLCHPACDASVPISRRRGLPSDRCPRRRRWSAPPWRTAPRRPSG